MKNNKSIYIVGIFMLITMVSIGYAILTGQLNINGTAKVKAASWDIYFKNIKIKDGSVTASVKPSITDKTTVNFEVELKKPGDFYEFNVDVVNDGDLDAMIESISITPELTVNQQKYLSYSVTYFDDVPLEVKDILHAKKFRTLKVKVEYKKNIENNDLVSNDEIINIKATIKYVQADDTAKEISSLESEYIPFEITKIKGDGTHVGDELAIGDEHFYVINNDGNNVVLFAKYNLNATPVYDPSMTYQQNTDETTSPVPFSSNTYWGYPAHLSYVYDDRASISNYVNNYKIYLESFDVEIKEARLITLSEMVNLGCGYSASMCQGNYYNSVPTKTAYWTGNAHVSEPINNKIQVFIPNVTYTFASTNYNNSTDFGVRPVIVIPVDSL